MSTCDLPLKSTADIGLRVAEYVTGFLQHPQAYRGQQLRGGGPVAEFEQLLSARCGFPHCLATSNATTALLVLALAADLEGKEVIAAPNSWGGTYGPFEFTGAKLVTAESDSDGNICPASVERLITPTTAAVLAVDWKGVCHQTKRIRSICDQANLLYITDSSWMPDKDSVETSLADVQIMSFGPGKPLSLGEGGALLAQNCAIYAKAIALSQHEERCRSEGITPESTYPFLNSRMHPVAALLGLYQMG